MMVLWRTFNIHVPLDKRFFSDTLLFFRMFFRRLF